MAYNKKDMELLSEAYSLTLLKEQAPNMTLGQVQSRLHLMTESELLYIIDLNEGILGGLSNIGSGIKNAAKGALQGVKNVGSNVANVAGSAVQGAKSAVDAVKGNVANMYNTGNTAVAQTKSLQQANDSITQLTQALTQADDAGLLGKRGSREWENLSLKLITQKLQQAQQQASQNAQTASQGGFLKGAGQAASAAYNAARQPAPAQAGQPKTA